MTQGLQGWYQASMGPNGSDPAMEAASGDNTYTPYTGATPPSSSNDGYAQSYVGNYGNAGGSGLNETPGGVTDPFGIIQNGGNGYETTSQPYDAAINTATSQASNFNNAAQGVLGQQAAQINNPYAAQTAAQQAGVTRGQNALMGQLNKTAQNGTNSAAYQQYQAGVRQNLAAQTAIANSAGGGIAGAGAKRAAQQGNAMTAAGSQAGAQLTAQQAQQAAQGQLGTLASQQAGLQNAQYGASQSQAAANATLQQQQIAQNYAGQLGYNNLAANEQTQQLNALQGAATTLLGTEGVSLQGQQIGNQLNQEYLGTELSAGTGFAGALGSVPYGQNQNQNQNQNQTSQSSGPSEADLENPYYGS